jgi:hypothetical protein
LDLLLSFFKREVCLFVCSIDLLVDVGDVPFNLVDAFGVLVVAFVLTHETQVLLVYEVHLGLVVTLVGVFGLDCQLDVISYLFNA